MKLCGGLASRGRSLCYGESGGRTSGSSFHLSLNSDYLTNLKWIGTD
jgi:hypothetical protein